MLGYSFINWQNPLLLFISPAMEMTFHWAIGQMLFVAVGVLLMIGANVYKGAFYRSEKGVAYYELLWSAAPVGILVIIALPGMSSLYVHEMEMEPALTVQCEGHQWYWSYIYTGGETQFDAFMVQGEDLLEGVPRYLDTDNHLVLPQQVPLHLFITSTDVIHSWALPSLTLKLDATPGRLNLVTFSMETSGLFYGQCSELCGANHSFMPIAVESTPSPNFLSWFSAS